MNASLIKEIEEKMQGIIDSEQMRQLHQVLEDCLSSELPEEEKTDLVRLFLAAKRVEGCSEKTVKYYSSVTPWKQASHDEVLFSYPKFKRRTNIMKEFWNTIQLAFAAVGGWLGYFLGGCDGLLYALLAFVVIDYITGVMCAIADKTLSSEVGFKGICRKVLILLLVGIANVLDVQVIGTGSVLRTAVIFFYISNEGVSLLENAAHLGLPVPEKIKTVLEQLHDRAEDEE